MLNNITNYTNLIDNNKVRTLLEASDLFTIGVRDLNFYGNYQPALITTTDLVSSIASLLPPATAAWGSISGNINTQGDLISLLNAKQNNITLTTTGSSGAATLIGSTLNIPNYAGGGSLPYWLEYNESDKTIWNNGNGNIGTNTSYGQYALSINTNGANTTAVGNSALYANTTGTDNTAVGYLALSTNTSGAYNTAIGNNTLLNNTTGSENTALGKGALISNTSGNNNVALGANSLNSNTTGTQNTAIGFGTLGLNTIGNRNSAYGVYALNSTTTIVSSLGPIIPGSGYTDGTYTNIELDYLSGSTCSNRPYVNITVVGGIVTACTLSGSVVLSSRGTGFKDISTVMTSYLIGPGTGFTISPATLSTGINNIGIGFNTGEYNENGNDNITIGNYALQKSTSSSNMIVIGHNAIATTATFNSSNTIAIGNNITSSNRSGCIILGFGAGATANNQFVVGSVATNAGAVTSEVNTSSNVWNVIINGVARKILLA
jgi:hypothetical protein